VVNIIKKTDRSSKILFITEGLDVYDNQVNACKIQAKVKNLSAIYFEKLKRADSWNEPAIIWIPEGIPFLCFQSGRVKAGIPARLACMV
jgi:hypothetical protein